MKLVISLFTLVALAAFDGSRAQAQQIFYACIGEGGVWLDGSGCPANAGYYFECPFARAHPTDTDQAAANEICITYKAFKRAGVQRLRSYDGHNCGYIVIQVTCQN
jgi:hypothetical protein